MATNNLILTCCEKIQPLTTMMRRSKVPTWVKTSATGGAITESAGLISQSIVVSEAEAVSYLRKLYEVFDCIMI